MASVVENGAQVETQKRYLVPYLVWSNYGIEGAKDKNTSLNYLAAQVLTAAGVPTNAYQNYLLSLSKTYPVISAAGQTKGIGADEKQLQTYKKLQYYQLFEKTRKRMSKNMKNDFADGVAPVISLCDGISYAIYNLCGHLYRKRGISFRG